MTLTMTVTEELMKSTGREAKGHGHGLASLLADSWSQKHQLQPLLPQAGPTRSSYRPTKCCGLGFCHCGEDSRGEQAFHFHCKLVSLLKPFLFTKRQRKPKAAQGLPQPKKEQTKGRRAVSKAFLVLKLEPTKPPTRDDQPIVRALGRGADSEPVQKDSSCSQARPSMWSRWKGVGQAVAEKSNPERTAPKLLPESLWFHLGYFNFKQMHFSGLPLRCMNMMNHGLDDDVLAEAHLEVDQQTQFYRSFEFFKGFVSFPHAWVASFWLLKSSDASIPSSKMPPKHIVATPYLAIPPFQTWKGEVQERLDRKDSH